MIYNILNGDSLAHSFPGARIQGETIVAREALIDGDLSGDILQDFWQTRAKYLNLNYEDYYSTVVKEFEKILDAPDNSEFNLWFEYDLFCQVNMWFVISIINNLRVTKKVFAVYTSYLDRNSKHFWNGFGPAAEDELITSFNNKILLNDADLQFGNDLWLAYKNEDLEALSQLSENKSKAFPYLKEVIDAHIDRFPKEGEKGRPEKLLEDITKNISTGNTSSAESMNRKPKRRWQKSSCMNGAVAGSWVIAIV